MKMHTFRAFFGALLAAVATAVGGVLTAAASVPATGDDSNASLVIWVLVGSGVLIVVFVLLSILGKKKK